MQNVNDIFHQGAPAVRAWFLQPDHSGFRDMDFKELADICWTRAGSLAKGQPGEARAWALAALAGYEHLARHGEPAAAESAADNVAALRSWKLLGDPLPIG